MRKGFLYIFISHTDFSSKIQIFLVIYTDFVLDQSGRSAYALFRVFMSAPHLEPANFLTIVRRVLAFFSAFSMWDFHVSGLSKVMPRYVGLSSCFKHFPFILSTIFFWLGERLNTEYVVLSAFSLNIHLFVYLHKISSACGILFFAT